MPNPPIPEPKTLVVDKFNGRITRFRNGDINSGMSPQYFNTMPWGYDCLQQSGILSFNQAPVSIKGSIITDLVVAARVRLENSISYVYAVGHTGRVYKIQVNDPTTKDPDYDNPVLLATLALGQTFQVGSSIDFYTIGGTEYILIGHDTGVTRLDIAGTGETAIGSVGAGWVTAVPRQEVQFIGSIFYTNGSNIAQIDSTGTVSTYTKISPGFPANMTARDIDTTPDGRYVVVAVTKAVPASQTSTSIDTGIISSTNSLLVYWNGTDTAASSSTSFPNFPISSYTAFGANEFIFGEQIGGAMIGTPGQVINVLEFEQIPSPNAVSSSGDFLGYASTRISGGYSKAIISLYGTIDNETPIGFYKQLLLDSTLTNGDVIRVPVFLPVSSWQSAGTSAGYTNVPFQLFGTGKSYFSTIEYDGSTTAYNFYSFKNVLDFQNTANTGFYQTQTQLFGKQVKPTDVRVYMEAFSSLTSFKIDLIGIDGNVLSGGTKTFTSTDQANNACKFTPYVGQVPALGLRITNAGVVTPIIHKVEIDYTDYGD